MVAYKTESGKFIYLKVEKKDGDLFQKVMEKAKFTPKDDEGNLMLNWNIKEAHIYTDNSAEAYFANRVDVPVISICFDRVGEVHEFLAEHNFVM